jgi:hypothetical protein
MAIAYASGASPSTITAMPRTSTKPSSADARIEHLDGSQRTSRSAPIRNTFVQRGPQHKPEPGVLAEMVRRHDATALDLFLLLAAKAVAPVTSKSHDGQVYSVTYHNEVWGRLLGGAPASTAARAWARLDEEYNVVRRKRSGRHADVMLLNESGDGTPYERPSNGAADRYFRLPFAYWVNGPDDSNEVWVDTLSLPAKAMLLISLSLKPGFVLPVERAVNWYGISGDSAQRGLDELRKHDLLLSEPSAKPAPLTKAGVTMQYRHTLINEFKHQPSSKRTLRAVA